MEERKIRGEKSLEEERTYKSDETRMRRVRNKESLKRAKVRRDKSS